MRFGLVLFFIVLVVLVLFVVSRISWSDIYLPKWCKQHAHIQRLFALDAVQKVTNRFDPRQFLARVGGGGGRI